MLTELWPRRRILRTLRCPAFRYRLCRNGTAGLGRDPVENETDPSGGWRQPLPGSRTRFRLGRIPGTLEEPEPCFNRSFQKVTEYLGTTV